MEFFSVMAQVWSKYSHLFLHGLWMTVYMGLVTVAISTVTGSILALIRRSSFKPLQWIVTAYVEVIRGTPILLQLYFFYFMLPGWLPFLELSEFACVLIACCVNSTAYVCEIVRAGIQAVDIGQTEAARSLGLNKLATMRFVVLPQAIKNALPALANEFIVLLKETSVAGYIAMQDLTKAGDLIRGRTFSAFMPLIAVALIYLVLVVVLTALVGVLERSLRKNER